MKNKFFFELFYTKTRTYLKIHVENRIPQLLLLFQYKLKNNNYLTRDKINRNYY